LFSFIGFQALEPFIPSALANLVFVRKLWSTAELLPLVFTIYIDWRIFKGGWKICRIAEGIDWCGTVNEIGKSIPPQSL
jgi:hypothetical protein